MVLTQDTPVISRHTAEHLIRHCHRGRMLSVLARKDDGSVRLFNGRLGVRKGVKGMQPDRAEQDRAHGLVTLFRGVADRSPSDNGVGGFRRVRLNSVVGLAMGGRVFRVK